MKLAGQILLIAGAIGVIYFGYQAIDATKSVSVFGEKLTVSSADWTPVIVSAIVLVVGMVLRKK